MQGNSVVDSIKTFLIDSLNIPAETVANMEILSCFRIGKPDPNKTDDIRTIVAKFLRSNDVSLIITATRKKPKGSPGGVQEDLPLSWAKTRQELHKKFVIPTRTEPGSKNIKIK